MTLQERQELDTLKATVQSLTMANSIPYNVEQAFRDRLKIGSLSIITSSSKSANSENVAVDTSSLLTYNVLGIPDGYVKVKIETGVIVNMPYYL